MNSNAKRIVSSNEESAASVATSNSSTNSKKHKATGSGGRTPSQIWEHFQKNLILKKAYCKHCDKVYDLSRSGGSTKKSL